MNYNENVLTRKMFTYEWGTIFQVSHACQWRIQDFSREVGSKNNKQQRLFYPLFKIKIRLNYSDIDVKKTNFRYQPYLKKKPIRRLQKQQSKPNNFNLQITDYAHNTTSYSKLFLQSHNLQNLVNPEQLNIT